MLDSRAGSKFPTGLRDSMKKINFTADMTAGRHIEPFCRGMRYVDVSLLIKFKI